MDRNQATGLLLIALMVLLYFQFFAPDPQKIDKKENTEPQATEQQVAEDELAEVPEKQDTTSVPDSVRSLLNTEKYGAFAMGATGEEETVSVSNKNLALDFSTKGATITRVELKDFKTYEKQPLYLLTPESSQMRQIVQASGKEINLSDLYYTAEKEHAGDTTRLTFSLDLANGGTVSHIYTLPDSSYEVGYRMEIKGVRLDSDVQMQWNDNLIVQEKDITLSRHNSTINYYSSEGDFDGLNERSNDTQTESLDQSLKWVSIKQRFFVSGIIAEKSFSGAEITTKVDPDDSLVVKNARVVVQFPANDISKGGQYTYYFGPNDYHILKNVTEDFSKNLYLGWPPMIYVNKWIIIPLFDLLNNFLNNYGLIIIIMVLLIKLVLSPLSYKSYLSMAKMKVLKPQLDEIKKKHPDDMQKAQQEQMKLYQQVGVNPISGCIPMLLQMPIIFSMFYFFPQSIELRGKPFLWADDLSTYDSIAHLPFQIPFYGDHVSLFVLLMTMSTILYTWSNQQVSSVQGPMKSISYFMPIIFLFVLNSYPAALSFYYFVSNLVTFGQQALIRKFVDEEKIEKILDENKRNAGTKKVSKFQQKIQDAMKAQQSKQGGKR